MFQPFEPFERLKVERKKFLLPLKRFINSQTFKLFFLLPVFYLYRHLLLQLHIVQEVRFYKNADL